MTEKTIEANGITIAYEQMGDPSSEPLLLIMGLGAQMIGWPDEFCQKLADRGFFVTRFDNRDAGLSTHFHDAPKPDPQAAMEGDHSSAAYSLSDMAADAAGLLDALGIEKAHIAGASMGGMIAQQFAIDFPERTKSLTSIMSTTGDIKVGTASRAAVQVLMTAPPTDREGVIAKAVADSAVIGSSGFPRDEEFIRQRAGRAYDRAFDPLGTSRQLVAIRVSGDRTEALKRLDVPTLVLHGEADALVSVTGGQATAAAIPGAKLVTIPGMGHDMPREVWDTMVEEMAELARI